MSLFIDIFIIIAAIAAIYSGISRGFVKSVMGFVSLILAIAAAFIFTPQLADFYNVNVPGAGGTKNNAGGV